MVLAVANSRNAGCGRMTRLWSSSVSRPDDSSTRWITNITSGRPASYSSKQSATLLLVGPGQDAVAEFGDLHAVLDDDGVLADQVDTADVAVEVDAHAGPVEPRRDLLDMGRLAGAVIARDDHAAVVGEAGEDRERGRRGRSGSPDRCPAHGRRPWNRPELPCRCRCRKAAGPTPSCRACRRACAVCGAVAIATPWPRNGAGPRFFAGISMEWGELSRGRLQCESRPAHGWNVGIPARIVEETGERLCCRKGRAWRRPSPPTGRLP